MTVSRGTLSPGQFMILIVQTQIGINVLYMPSSVESIVKNDAWISMLLAGTVSTLFIVIMWLLASRLPNASCAEYMPRLLGKTFGTFAQLIYAVMFVLNCSLILVLFADVVRDWLLSETPKWVIIGLMLFVGTYLGREHARTIARFCMITSFLILLLLSIAAYAFKNANILYILPVGEQSPITIAHGALKAFYSLFGFEILLFVFPLVEGGHRSALKALMFANLFSTLVYVFLVFLCLVVFSPEELRIIPQPVLYMIKALSFTVFERADLYFLSIWTIIVISTVASYVFMSGTITGALFGRRSHRRVVPYASVVVFVCALLPSTQSSINVLETVVSTLGWATLIVLPTLMLIVTFVRNINEKEAAER